MKKLAWWIAAVGCLILSGSAAGANCQNEGPYEIRQCAKRTWFAPPPAGAGSVSAAWWAVGYGNANARTPDCCDIPPSPEGSAFIPAPLPGLFIGADSGALTVPADLDLVDASTVMGVGGPPGSLCFSSASNWGSPGVDSCADVNRNDTGSGGALDFSDGYLNIYWDPLLGTNYYYLNHQLDPPMGVLLTESNSRYFALAFFASEPRPHDPTPGFPQDITPGQFNMGLLVNGQPGPTGNNVVPWQPIPQQNITAFCEGTTCQTIMIHARWAPAAIVSDGSTRPCLMNDFVTPCASFAPGVTGVGVRDQGALDHYELETAPLNATIGCGTTWTPLPGGRVDGPTGPVFLSIAGIAPRTCVRLTTHFGRPPEAACTDAIVGCRNSNRLAAQTGRLGDVGYQVSSRPSLLGGPLVAESVTLKSVVRGQKTVTIQWETISELSVTGFDIEAVSGRRSLGRIVASVPCAECTTGRGASYTEIVPVTKLRGARSVRVVMRPSGIASNPLDIH